MTDTQSARCTVNADHELPADRATWTTCRPCEDWTRDTLNEIERLWPDLANHLERGRGAAGPRVSGNTKTAGSLPLSEAVLGLIGPGGVHDRLQPYLTDLAACRLLRVPPVTGTADHRVATIIGRLRNHLPWAVRNYNLRDMAVELQKLAGEMRAVTGQTGGVFTAKTQRCPAEYADGSICEGPIQLSRETGTIHCGACGRAFTLRDLTALAVVHARGARAA